MGTRTITDWNEFLPDGETPNLNYGQTATEEIPDPSTAPLILSDTAFAEFSWAQLGSGTVGMSRFQAVLDDAYDHGGAAKAASRQLDRLASLTKTQADGLLAPILLAGCISQGERDAIIGNWPEG